MGEIWLSSKAFQLAFYERITPVKPRFKLWYNALSEMKFLCRERNDEVGSEVKPFENLVRELIVRWRDDAGGTYRTWFLWEERIKNFRSIRRGLSVVVKEIESRTFGEGLKAIFAISVKL